MFIALRYFVTVRRATVIPRRRQVLDQLLVALRPGLVFAVDQFLEFQADRIPSHLFAVGPMAPPQKNRFSGKMPRGV